MRQLRGLRVLQIVDPIGPIGAAILHVIGIEHQLVEIIADVIVVRGVLARTRGLVERGPDEAHALHQSIEWGGGHDVRAVFPAGIHAQELGQLHDVTLFDDNAAIHIGLARTEPRVAQYVGCDLVVGQP